MAVVNGTAGNDLIHVAGDGLIAPPGFIHNAGATVNNDTLNGLGGVGIDVISYGGVGGDAQGDVINGIENVNGAGFGDILTGSAAANTLNGLGATAAVSDHHLRRRQRQPHRRLQHHPDRHRHSRDCRLRAVGSCSDDAAGTDTVA